jgi:hypothetical protein
VPEVGVGIDPYIIVDLISSLPEQLDLPKSSA